MQTQTVIVAGREAKLSLSAKGRNIVASLREKGPVFFVGVTKFPLPRIYFSSPFRFVRKVTISVNRDA